MFKLLLICALVGISTCYAIIKYTESINIISYTGMAICLFLSFMGTSKGMSSISRYVTGLCIMEPRVANKSLFGTIMCEANFIFGFMIIMLMGQKMGNMVVNYSNNWILLCVGLLMGSVVYLASTAVGVICGAVSLMDAKHSRLFFKILILEMLPASVSLFGVIISVCLLEKLELK